MRGNGLGPRFPGMAPSASARLRRPVAQVVAQAAHGHPAANGHRGRVASIVHPAPGIVASTTSPPQRVLLKFPTRQRPGMFFATLERWLSMASGRHEIRSVVSLDADDATMNNDAVLGRLRAMPGVEAIVGQSASKVDACNRDLAGRSFDVLVLASDDMVPEATGWDEIVVHDMLSAFPNRDGALHYHDGHRDDIITLSVMGGNLYRHLGYVYHPRYWSLWCDNDFTQVVRRIGKYEKKPGVVLARHMHPANGHGVSDGLYARNDRYFKADQETYRDRERREFGIRPPALSVLVPTIPERAASRDALFAELNRQIFALADPWQVEIRAMLDDGTMPVGAKRNRLVAEALGRWVCFVDDDDMVADTYVPDILGALGSDPDCVTFMGRLENDGVHQYDWRFGRGCQDGVMDNAGVLWRMPNHLCPVRTSLARGIPFPEIRCSEDSKWAAATTESGLLKTSAVIDKVLYHYRFSQAGSRTQTAPLVAPRHRPVTLRL